MPHVTSLKVRFYELDPYDHVNHAAYIQYFEVARIELLDSVGMNLTTMQSRGFQLVVTDLKIRYLAPAGSGDVLTIETDVSELRRASTVWRQRMLRGDELMAEQEIVAAVTNLGGRPVRSPPELAAALSTFRPM